MPGAATEAVRKRIRSHALIGQNGTGKSNLVEALITIFRDIDLDRDASLDYTLEYEIRGHTVRIQADAARQKRPFVWVDGDRVSQDYARGNVVSEFLDKLWQVSWAPIEQEATKQIDFRGRTEKQRQLYLFVPNQAKLKDLGELVGGTDSFFRYAEGAYIGDLIDEVRITVKKCDEHGGKVSFTQLSEGELQMLTVLGLMRITREDHCLFLLDEPDTHLNPIWKLRYFDDIEGVLDANEDKSIESGSQILITTHDPMMVGSLKREQVYILRRQGNRTVVDAPDEHPQGMGVTGLLKSELFGLSSTLDIETERRLFRRNDLFVKSPRTAEEDAELSRLSAELADLGFSNADFRDPDYALFVRKMAEHRKFRKPTLTPEEQAEQDRIADEIIAEILREEAHK
jgi:predicted ATPase